MVQTGLIVLVINCKQQSVKDFKGRDTVVACGTVRISRTP